MEQGTCSVIEDGEVCGLPIRTGDMCGKHYQRWRKHGDPLVKLTRFAGWHVARDYFLDHVFDDSDEHFPWPFGTHDYGYAGTISIDGVIDRAYVWACIFHHGPRPEPHPTEGPFQVAHQTKPDRCPPDCWNGRHLRWATARENSADMVIDGTLLVGVNAPWAKCDRDEVLDIRRRYALGLATQRRLAAEYGLGQATISRIVTRVAYPILPVRAVRVQPSTAGL